MLAYVFVLLTVAVRVLSGTGYFSAMGFTPMGASLLFFGSHQPRKRMWIPVAALMLSDVYLTVVKYHMQLPWDQALIWLWYAAMCLVGFFIKDRIKPLYVGAAALTSAISFYVVSDFGVWLSGYVGYPKTLAGLVACYVAAIPFLEKMLASDFLFCAVFFSMPVLIEKTRRAFAGETQKNAV